MMMTPEPFLSAEIEYRQQHLAEQYAQGAAATGCPAARH